MKLKNFFRSKIFSWIVLAILMCAVIFVFYLRARVNSPLGIIPADGAMHVRFFDVGQGDAALIVAPDGSDILIDGGPDGRILEYLGRSLVPSDRTLELVVLTHPHADHLIGLLEVLKHYKVDAVMMTGVDHSTEVYKEWLLKIKNKGIPVIHPKEGDSYLYGGMELKVLAPFVNYDGRRIVHDSPGEGGGFNETSIVLLADYGDAELLLMGDAGSETEKKILKETDIGADILKVGHHGSKYSTTPEFVNYLRPRFAIISSGILNKYGHPHYRTLRTLERAGVGIYRTDTEGTINAWSDRGDFKLNAERLRFKKNDTTPCQDKFFMIRWFLRCNS